MGDRLLIVTDHYPPFIGGAHRQSQLIALEMSRRGYHVNVATVWQPGTTNQQRDDDVLVHRLKELRTCIPALVRGTEQRHHPPFPDPLTTIGLRRIFQKFQPDLIHSHGWITYSCAAALTGLDIPLLVTARDYGYGCATRNFIYDNRVCPGPSPFRCFQCAGNFYGATKGTIAVVGVYGGRQLLRHKTTAFHTVSNFVRSALQRDVLKQTLLGSTPSIHVIPSFREVEPVRPPSPAFLAKLPAQPFILFVGALQIRKGVPLLLHAYQRLERRPPLVLIGTLAPDTPKEISSEVTVLLNVPHVDVMAAWERSLFGVAPSLWPEPFGSVVHEAMSTGKAVIGTVPGGHADMLDDGETGMLVPAGDLDALTAAMQRLTDDDVLRDRLGRAAQRSADRFTVERIIPQIDALYQEILQAHSASPPPPHATGPGRL